MSFQRLFACIVYQYSMKLVQYSFGGHHFLSGQLLRAVNIVHYFIVNLNIYI